MTSNILMVEQDIYTITPLVLASLLGLLIKTGKWRNEIILTLFLMIDMVRSTMILYGKLDVAFWVTDISSVVVVVYALFRKRGCRA